MWRAWAQRAVMRQGGGRMTPRYFRATRAEILADRLWTAAPAFMVAFGCAVALAALFVDALAVAK